MDLYKQNKNKKTSIGIALCDESLNKILLVKSRITYNFASFVFGKYKIQNIGSLITRFNNMTNHEKLLISSCDFEKLWYHIWLKIPSINNPEDTFLNFYINCKTKFDKIINRDNGKGLKNLLNKANSIELGWSIPKGRQSEDEKEIDCAIREFKEETNIDIDQYKLLTHIKPICTSYEDENVIYVSKYYVATLPPCAANISNKLNFYNTCQIGEISDMKWFKLSEIPSLTSMDKKLYYQIQKVFTLIKNKHNTYASL